MADETVEQPKKRRGWPPGKPRGPRKAKASPAPMFTSAVEAPAPINVRVTLRNGAAPVEFGCSQHIVENGFHVFFYPSKTDPYRETRREFAISEIVEIEITEARQVYNFVAPAQAVLKETPPTFNNTAGPKIHSARQSAAGILGALEQSSGPIKMDRLPDMNIGGAPRPVTFGDSEA